MNQRLQGWKLALALLIPAAIIGIAAFIAYGALTGDNQEVSSGADEIPTQVPTLTPTQVPLTQAVPPAPVPTEQPPPTAVQLPTPPPAAATPVATAEPVEAEPTATAVPSSPPPTSAPAPVSPAPTATPDVTTATLTCSGTIPGSVEPGQGIGPLSAAVSPVAAAAGFQFTWGFGTSTVVTSPTSGTITYASPGTYTITVTGTNATTGQALTATCGTVTVARTSQPVSVSCSVAPVNSEVKLKDARSPENMRVTTSWTPSDVPLYLQYEFETNDALIIVNPASSGDRQTNAFGSDGAAFSVFWRDASSGETGRLSCPAYPNSADDPEPTATPTLAAATVTPTATETAEPSVTATVEATATATVEPTATATVEPTATPTETETVEP